MTPNRLVPTMLVLASAVLLAAVACGSSTTPTGAVDTANPTAGAEAATGEGVPVPYIASKFPYRMHPPGRLAAKPDGPAAYVGPSERLEIVIIQGATPVDSSALPTQDIKSL